MILNKIINKIKKINYERQKKGLCLIHDDETNEVILNILDDYFFEERLNGEDIDSQDFLEDKFGADALLIRDAEAGYYQLEKIK